MTADLQLFTDDRASRDSEARPRSLLPVKILMVDDEPNNLTALETVLAADDRTLVRAGSGSEALRHVLQDDFAVILLDVHMPGMDGFETAELIRGRERSRETPIIFLTAAISGEVSIAKGYSLGAVDYLVKPFAPEMLRAKVTVFIELFRKTEQVKQLAQEQAARAEAERARDHLQQVLDVLPEGILIADANGRISVCNAAALAILGRVPPEDDLWGYNTMPRYHLDGSDYPIEEVPLRRAVEQGEAVLGEQLLLQSAAAGGFVPVLMNAAPLRNREGEIIGSVAALQDISPIKELERQKDAFLAAASHDLKNPLAIVKAQAQLMMRRADRLEGRDTAPIVAGLRSIDQATRRLTGMVNELLDVARLQMGRPIELDPRPTDLTALVRGVAADFEPSTDRHEFRVEADDVPVVGMWDRDRIERVLVNLLTNAIKYSPEGGPIILSVKRQKQGSEEWAVLAVRDGGIGIPPDEIPHIFERFYRASNVGARIEGAGIGLSGVRQIVEQHGGDVLVESVERKGSTFQVRLPLKGPGMMSESAARG